MVEAEQKMQHRQLYLFFFFVPRNHDPSLQGKGIGEKDERRMEADEERLLKKVQSPKGRHRRLLEMVWLGRVFFLGRVKYDGEL